LKKRQIKTFLNIKKCNNILIVLYLRNNIIKRFFINKKSFFSPVFGPEGEPPGGEHNDELADEEEYNDAHTHRETPGGLRPLQVHLKGHVAHFPVLLTHLLLWLWGISRLRGRRMGR